MISIKKDSFFFFFFLIPKPDRDHSQCKNHRPIALLSGVGKLMERIITRRLMWWLNENNMLHQTQAGFQSWHNTNELLLRMTETIYKSFNNNSVTYAVLLDISSAYDSVWRNGLRYKMRNEFKLNGRLYWWIDSFLSQRYGRVVLNGHILSGMNSILVSHKDLLFHQFYSYFISMIYQRLYLIQQFKVECLLMMLHFGLQSLRRTLMRCKTN